MSVNSLAGQRFRTIGGSVPDRWQWTGALLGGWGVIGLGTFMISSRGGLVVVAMQALAIALLIAGTVVGIGAVGAMLVGVRSRWRIGPRVLITVQFLAVLVAVILAMVLAGWAGLIGGLGAVGVLALIAVRGGGVSITGESAARLPRTVWSILLAVLTLAALIFDSFHLRVWNPLAKVPGHSLDQIYAGLDAANKGQATVPFMVAWAVFWTPTALAFPVLAHAVRLTPRITAVLGLLMVGGVIFTGWYAAAAMGFGIADTFATGGEDAPIPSTAVLGVSGHLAFAAALIIALAPNGTGWRRPASTWRSAARPS
ncbi:hypothetical protein [Microlunatus speluncae]|uniref:hypothetical protein n=1 Tax=Microlunatus speluncae TaxID=2594267 RepID=UPI0012661B0C|nr:hypothetical protein [Microlunatus speluncae]